MVREVAGALVREVAGALVREVAGALVCEVAGAGTRDRRGVGAGAHPRGRVERAGGGEWKPAARAEPEHEVLGAFRSVGRRCSSKRMGLVSVVFTAAIWRSTAAFVARQGMVPCRVRVGRRLAAAL